MLHTINYEHSPFRQEQKKCKTHYILTILTAVIIGFVFLESAKSILFPTLNRVHSATLTLLFGLMVSGPGIYAIKKERNRCISEETFPQEIQNALMNTEQEAAFRLLFKSMSEGVALYRGVVNKYGALVNFQLMDVNDSWIRLMDEDPTDKIGAFLTDLDGFIEPAHLGIFRCVASTGEPQVFRQYRASVRKHIRVDVTRLYKGWIATTVETLSTGEEETLTAIPQTQRTESVGALAGGMAHRINNLLMIILCNTELVQQSLSPTIPGGPLLEEIRSATMQISDLCNKLLRYTGKSQFQMEPQPLDAIIEELQPILKCSIPLSISLHFNLADSLPCISADREELRQVITGLVANASEAIGDQAGHIVIATGAITCRRRYLQTAWLGDEAQEGEYVYLEVSDTGSGMNHETLKRIFDPFYSTKFMGRGLGLAATLGIVRAHRGAIKVHSQIGKGASIRILLPQHEISSKQLETQPSPRSRSIRPQPDSA